MSEATQSFKDIFRFAILPGIFIGLVTGVVIYVVLELLSK